MLKKVFVAASIVILTAGYAHAQINFGVRAGVNLTNMKMSYWESSIDGKMKPGIQLGIVGELEITKFLAIQPGLLFAQQGYINKKSFTGFSFEQTIALNYIQIPVNAIFKLDLNAVKLLGQVGPYFGFGINGKIKGDGHSEKITLGSGKDDYMKAFDFGFGLGTGVQYRFFQAIIGYNFGLANIANTDDDMYDVIGVSKPEKAKNNGFVITLTYLFGK